MKWCKAQYKRELEIVDQTQTQRYVSRFEHTALRPRLHTEGFLLTRPHRTSHTGNLHWRFEQIQLGSTQFLSHQIQPLTRGKAQHKALLHLEGYTLSQNNNQPLTRGIRLKANTNNNRLTLERLQHNLHNHLSLEGYQHNHLSLEGYHKEWKITTLGGINNHKLIFLTKIRS